MREKFCEFAGSFSCFFYLLSLFHAGVRCQAFHANYKEVTVFAKCFSFTVELMAISFAFFGFSLLIVF